MPALNLGTVTAGTCILSEGFCGFTPPLADLNLASQYCDRLLLLDNGRIYKTGFPEDVLTYQIIEEVYKTVVVIQNNPISLKPYVLLVPEEERQKRENKCKQKG